MFFFLESNISHNQLFAVERNKISDRDEKKYADKVLQMSTHFIHNLTSSDMIEHVCSPTESYAVHVSPTTS